MSNSVGLAVKGLVKQYDGFRLGPLTTTFEAGRCYGLLGPNGAGKTTLLQCLAGQAKPTSGTIQYAGRELRWGDWRRRATMAFITESPYFYDELSIQRNLEIAAGLYPNWSPDVAAGLATRLGLSSSRRFGDLSRGTKVKVALLASLAHQSDIVLLDEPTSGLDPDAREEIQDLLRDLVRPGVAMVVSSHIFEDIEAVSDELKIIRDGHLVVECPLAAVLLMRVASPPKGSRLPETSAGIGRWRSRDGDFVLLPPVETGAADPLLQFPAGTQCRPATVRDLYFAFGRQS